MYQVTYALGQLIGYSLLLLPVILFLLTQQNTLKVISSGNRGLNPGLVWLQLIPIFNFYWTFVVVIRISDSIRKEKALLTDDSILADDSILGMPDPHAAARIEKRPTYRIGITYCTLYLLFPVLIIFVNLFLDTNKENPNLFQFLGAASIILWLAIVTCWIIYWSQLAGEKRKLQYRPA